jgi:diadenosine tetraphosphate (Ap4A) HIT family hydrolase
VVRRSYDLRYELLFLQDQRIVRRPAAARTGRGRRLLAGGGWRVAHDFNSTLQGWLVLVPRRHVTSIADLTDEEAGTLGMWQVRLSRALRTVTGCVKTYVVQFAEKEGFAHVHFHIVPRMPNLPADRRGPGIFQYMDRDGTDLRLSSDDATTSPLPSEPCLLPSLTLKAQGRNPECTERDPDHRDDRQRARPDWRRALVAA